LKNWGTTPGFVSGQASSAAIGKTASTSTGSVKPNPDVGGGFATKPGTQITKYRPMKKGRSGRAKNIFPAVAVAVAILDSESALGGKARWISAAGR
jgi:hypothetical protein